MLGFKHLRGFSRSTAWCGENKRKNMNANNDSKNDNNPKPDRLVYTVQEAALVLNVSTKTIRRLLARRLLTGSKALRKILIPREQLNAFLKATCDVPQALR
jgi:excisionase family DNA binding protein